MERIGKSSSDSFLKIVLFGSNTFEKLNQVHPYYGDERVKVISVTPIGTDKGGNTLFCYELEFYR